MTATARGRVAVAALIVALVFAAAFAVRKATAGKLGARGAHAAHTALDSRARPRRHAVGGGGAGAAPRTPSERSRAERPGVDFDAGPDLDSGSQRAPHTGGSTERRWRWQKQRPGARGLVGLLSRST